MPLTIGSKALDWSLKHALRLGDTDIFPPAFEFQAMEANWANTSTGIQSQDALDWNVRPARRCLAPKHKFGFRISTQLDPLDFLIYTALLHEIGAKLEARRVPLAQGIVHSYRFHPSSDGRMFSKDWTFRTFQKESLAACDRHTRYVAIADIADFFPRISTHRVDNTLDKALGIGHMHATLLKRLVNQWAGPYSFGIPVGSAASRLLAEVTIADVDQALLSEGVRYVRYSDDFRFFCKSESEAYRCLTLVARFLWEHHGLTLQQSKTRVISVKSFKEVYLRENERREVDTLSERFYELVRSLGIDDQYEDIDFDSLSPEAQAALQELNLHGILEEQIKANDVDLSLIKFLLRRLGQIGKGEASALVLKKFARFVPVIREAIEYLMQVSASDSAKKVSIGDRLLTIYADSRHPATHLEYARMYLLFPFAVDRAWNTSNRLVKLRAEAVDEFAIRELTLALGRSEQDYWFRGRKQTLMSTGSWVRRAFIYGASCLPADEYKHWIRGVQSQLDPLDEAVASWAAKNPIA
jgi:Reverse transcriptase (RNA-dependent DNA polymerase)